MTEVADFTPEWFTDRLRQFENFQQMHQRVHPQTLMLVETPYPYGKTWLLKKMVHHCMEADPPLPVVYIDFRNKLIESVDDFQVMQLLARSIEEPALFQPFFTAVARNAGDDLWLPAAPMQSLIDEILAAFNSEGQLKLLFRFAEVNYDLLPGDGAAEKTFEFLADCLRREKLNQLLEVLIEERGDRGDSWRGLIADIEQAAESAPALPASGFATLKAVGEEREHIMQAITAVFIDCLKSYLGQIERLVILLDSYEDSTFEARRWIVDKFLPHLPQETIKTGLILVVAGRQTFYVEDPNVRGLILPDKENKPYPDKHYVGLFGPEHIEEYIKKRNVTADWATLDKLLLVTDGNPDLLAKIYEQKLMV